VLDGMRLCPPNTILEMVPLYSADREARVKAAAKSAELSAGRPKINLDEKEEHVRPAGGGADGMGDEESEDELEPEKVSMKLFGIGDGKMSRFAMLRGMIQTFILMLLLFTSISFRLDLAAEKPLCLSLESAFADHTFTSGTDGSITSLRTINSATNFREYLALVFPAILFGSSSAYEEQCSTPGCATDTSDNSTAKHLRDNYPAVIAGHTVMLGGMRLLQLRGDVNEQDRCQKPYFVPPDDPYPTSQGTCMLRQPFGSPPVNTTVLTDERLRNQAMEKFMTAPDDFGNSTLCYSATEFSEAPFGPMRPELTGQAQQEEWYAQGKAGAPGATYVPEVSCFPPCDPPDYTGILPAFVYQSSADLGRPYSLINNRPLPGGYAITLPANVTYSEYDNIMSRLLTNRWFDRQSRSIHINVQTYNLQHHMVADLHLTVSFDISGFIISDTACAAVPIDMTNWAYLKMIPEILLTLWLLIRGLLISSQICIKKKPAPGQRPVRCLITAELCVHFVTTILGLLGSYYRFSYIYQQSLYRPFFQAGEPWPPPYMPEFGAMIVTFRNSVFLYGWALLTCTLRFSLYYSIISKRLYILRLTISRATYRLLPTLTLLVSSLAAFAVFGNQLYFLTVSSWQDIDHSLGKVLYLLRRPMAMDFQRMAQANIMWPLDSDEPNPLTVIFLLGFTCVTIWIMANLYRAVIIIEYATVVQIYRKQPPGDLTDDPWPSFNPFELYRKRAAASKEARFKRRIAGRQRVEWRQALEVQKRKQRALQEKFKKSGDESTSKGKGSRSASPKKGKGAAADGGEAKRRGVAAPTASSD